MLTAEEARKRSDQKYTSTFTKKDMEEKVEKLLEKANEIIFNATEKGVYSTEFGIEFKSENWKQHRSVITVPMRVLHQNEYQHRTMYLTYNECSASQQDFLKLLSPEKQKELLQLEIRLFGATQEEIMRDFRKIIDEIILALQKAGYQVDTHEYFCGCLFTVSWSNPEPTEE